MSCGILVPRIDIGMPLHRDANRCVTECDRSSGHDGGHSFVVAGTRVTWEDDECDCCDGSEFDRCFSWWATRA